MGAISRGYGAGEAAVLALEAGSDVLLVPEDVGEAIDAVEVAVRTGRVAPERIDRSVRLLLAAKARVGLHQRRTVDPAAVPEVAGSASHLTFADLAAERSVTLVRDRDRLVPLPAGARGRVVSVTYARDQDLIAGREFDRVAAHFVDGFRSLRLDEGSRCGGVPGGARGRARCGRGAPQRVRASVCGSGLGGGPGCAARDGARAVRARRGGGLLLRQSLLAERLRGPGQLPHRLGQPRGVAARRRLRAHGGGGDLRHAPHQHSARPCGGRRAPQGRAPGTGGDPGGRDGGAVVGRATAGVRDRRGRRG